MPGTALHERVWTVDDRDEVPDDGYRYECVDGRLLRMTPPKLWHQNVVFALAKTLDDQLPQAWQLVFDQGVRLGSDWRIPDIMIISTTADPERHTHDPAGVVLAVEVVSDGSHRTDRVLKPAEYADAGIAHYWRLETVPEVELWTYATDGRRYADPVRRVGSVVVEPFGIRLDLNALARRSG